MVRQNVMIRSTHPCRRTQAFRRPTSPFVTCAEEMWSLGVAILLRNACACGAWSSVDLLLTVAAGWTRVSQRRGVVASGDLRHSCAVLGNCPRRYSSLSICLHKKFWRSPQPFDYDLPRCVIILQPDSINIQRSEARACSPCTPECRVPDPSIPAIPASPPPAQRAFNHARRSGCA